MGLVVFLIILFFAGLLVGALARLLVPGPDPMGTAMTTLVGLSGTFSAGLFSWYVLHRHGAGLVLSVAFSMLVVWIYRRSRGGYSRRTASGSRSRS
ncbi:MAG: GlsB/YeaQ/YmgE family stress response membrane protein [Solirubrobacteraceae bacterium]